MRNALLIAQTQVPFQAPARTVSAQRTYGYSRYLPASGWRPIVVCADHRKEGRYSVPSEAEIRRALASAPEECVNLSTGHGSERDVLTRTYEACSTAASRGGVLGRAARLPRRALSVAALATTPLESRAWLDQPRRAVANLLEVAPVAVCVASLFPDSSARLAREICASHGVPWIADFRDHVRTAAHPAVRRLATARLRQLVDTASAIVTVSEPLADELAQSFGRAVDVVTNGYFEEDYADLRPAEPGGDDFTVVYTGSVYGPRLATLRVFFDGLAALHAQAAPGDSRVVFRYFGSQGDAVREAASQAGAAQLVELGGPVDRTRALREQLGADALLMITWDDPSVKGHYSAKIFEYLRARRPILAVPGDRDVVDELILRARAGAVARDAAAVTERLEGWARTKRSSGALPCDSTEAEISRFTRRNATQDLAAILDRVTA